MATGDSSDTHLLAGLMQNKLANESICLTRLYNSILTYHPKIASEMHETEEGPDIGLLMSEEMAKEVTNIDTIVYLRKALQIAVKLEMTVMFEYLFACFSVINSSDESSQDFALSENEGNYAPFISEIRREFKYQFMTICVQEMHHMRIACDLLISIGGIPNLQKVKFPSEFGIGKVHADLARLNLETLFKFIKYEEPFSGKEIPDYKKGFTYVSISQLYSAILAGFINIHKRVGNSMFYVKPGIKPMKSAYECLEDCEKDIIRIKDEGEGNSGQKLYSGVLDKIEVWVKDIKADDKIKEDILKSCEDIKKDFTDEKTLVDDILKLSKLLESFAVKTNSSLGLKEFEELKSDLVRTSHWGRFLVMALSYKMLMKRTGNEDKDENFSKYISRPSKPKPEPLIDQNNEMYHPITQKIVNLTNTSYHLLLKLLEANMISVPSELDDSYNITQRYNNISFYPIMSILIYPLGEVLSYFQLSKNDEKSTAGFPFIANTEDPYISDPLDKFLDIILTLERLHNQSVQLEKILLDDNKHASTQLTSCVGMWLAEQYRPKILARVAYMLKNIFESIRVVYLGFTNGIPVPTPKIKDDPVRRAPKEVQDKYYINIEFGGYVIYSMATDNDPTYETRGFCGSQFMFEYTHDPDFTDELYTKNTLTLTNNEAEKFTRDFIPTDHYEGVKITSAKLVLPCYAKFGSECLKFQKALDEEFKENKNIDFCFLPMKINGVQCRLRFPQLNYALTRHIAIDPIFIKFESDHFNVQRAHMLYTSKESEEKDNAVDFITACLEKSDNFGAFPKILNDRIPQSGGYDQWKDPFMSNKGLLRNTNLMHLKSGAGQCLDDFYTTYKIRLGKIMSAIDSTLKFIDDKFEEETNYLQDKDISKLVEVIKMYLDNFPQSKLIVLALIALLDITPGKINRLSYLCTRYINCMQLIAKNFIASPFQCFYHIPLNATDKSEFLTAITNNHGDDNILNNAKIITDQNWYLDFWVGAMDYDALTMHMSGNLMIPINAKLDGIQNS